MNKYYKLIEENASDILYNKNFISQKNYIQHSNVSIYDHTINVAIYALRIVEKFKIKVDRKTLIRGCLLHDYFLYDWHEKDKSHNWHGFIHAKRALINAEKEFELNKIEKNMIYTHMFPLNMRIPKYKESIILCLSDKICATKEIFRRG
ncbi:MAG: HD domain-containing protein [Bacilli bacterium]|nr:HD domain-containing protein [Bacilli bacterium]